MEQLAKTFTTNNFKELTYEESAAITGGGVKKYILPFVDIFGKIFNTATDN